MIRCGVIGGAGYVAGELIRVLHAHPEASIEWIASASHADEMVGSAHPDLFFIDGLKFSADLGSLDDLDVLFLCRGHGMSRATLQELEVPDDLVVIDLGNDFRLAPDNRSGNREFQYGLPEVYRQPIRVSNSIASPGCFATLLQLALLPLVERGGSPGPFEVTAITGSTGAGAGLSPTSHFSWRTANLSVYKPFSHQHEAEIAQTMKSIDPAGEFQMNFVPMRGPFARGIFASIHLPFAGTTDELRQLYHDRYINEPFVFVSDSSPDLKQVVNTNYALLHPEVIGGRALIVGVPDNLLKGAAGQAVQSMNLRLGIPETTGLHLKGSAF